MNYTLKIDDSARLTQFLKKFSVVSDSLLLVFTPDKLKANTHTPDRSIVKGSTAELSELFSEIPTDMPETIKIGVFLIDKLVQSFKFFGNSEFSFIIAAEEVNKEIVATNITMKSPSLKIKFATAPMSMFTYIDDAMFSKIANTDSAISQFPLNKEQQAQINSLFGIDVDYAKITFEILDKKLIAKGKNFDYKLDDVNFDDNETSIFKHHYVYIDREDSVVYALDDKLIVTSSESDTTIVIGQAS